MPQFPCSSSGVMVGGGSTKECACLAWLLQSASPLGLMLAKVPAVAPTWARCQGDKPGQTSVECGCTFTPLQWDFPGALVCRAVSGEGRGGLGQSRATPAMLAEGWGAHGPLP